MSSQPTAAAARLKPSHVWIDLPRGTVHALVDGETYALQGGVSTLGAIAQHPLRVVGEIKAIGFNPRKWNHKGRIEVPTWALGCYPIQHN